MGHKKDGLSLIQADLLLHLAVPKRFKKPERAKQGTYDALLEASLIYRNNWRDEWRPTMDGLAWIVRNLVPPR